MCDGALTFKLPGWRSTLRISPLKHNLDLSATHPLHGALTLVLGHPHQGRVPNFILCPRQMERYDLRDQTSPLWCFRSDAWQVHWLHPDAWRLSDTKNRVELFGALRLVEVGPMQEVSLPWPQEGRYHVLLESLSPFIMRHGSHERKTRAEHREMSGGLLLGAVHCSLKKLLGDGYAPLEKMRLCPSSLGWEYLRFHTGWNDEIKGGLLFHAVAEVDHLGLLALRILAEMGMGTYISRGFGRVRLSEVRRLDS